MDTNLMHSNQIQQTIEEIKSIAEIFVQSGYFTGVESFAKAFVKVQAGNEIGIKPFAAMSGIHIISGKPTIGAGIIASRIKASSKYDYRIKEMSDKICVIDFYQKSEKIGTETFTIEDAKKAQTKNIDKFPKNMLFARAISNGVKFFCPDIFDGPVYVPEEMQDVEDVKHIEVILSDDYYLSCISACANKKELNALYKKYQLKFDASEVLKDAAKIKQEDLKVIVKQLEEVKQIEQVKQQEEKLSDDILKKVADDFINDDQNWKKDPNDWQASL